MVATVATVVVTVAATTRRAARPGPDRASVLLFSLAAFFCVLALLAQQLRETVRRTPLSPRVVLVRRIYQTTIVETGTGAGQGISGSQSTSSQPASVVPAPPPTTRVSG